MTTTITITNNNNNNDNDNTNDNDIPVLAKQTSFVVVCCPQTTGITTMSNNSNTVYFANTGNKVHGAQA